MAELSDKQQKLLDMAQKWKSESENMRSSEENRWVRNMKIVKGRTPESEAQQSKVRKRSKLYFRKTWAVIWRIIAAMYQAFLRDSSNFQIEGRDVMDDPRKARVLQFILEWRRDWMMRTKSLFIKFVWAFKNIADLGWCCGKLSWEYNPETGEDGPGFTLYPNEQVYPDFSAATPDAMRYIIFENFLTKSDMEELGYDNIDEAEPMSVPSNIVRQTRQSGSMDPLQNPGEDEYAAAGRYAEGQDNVMEGARYRVWEIFYKEKGVHMMMVTNQEKCILRDAMENPYGNMFPDVQGLCLTEAHKLMGEGFPEPLEGPQESINTILNQRKDNIALNLAPMTHVSRFGNVDLASLVNRRPAGIVMMDEMDAVMESKTPDVTQSAYMEAAADEAMMHEMSGVTPGKMGLGNETKTGVAQIKLAESNAKIDLFLAITGETFVRTFFTKLAYLIQRFETDETVYRVANQRLRKEQGAPINGGPDGDVYDLGFEADLILRIGSSNAGTEMIIRQLMLAMDRATMHNQMVAGMLQNGMVPEGGAQMINTTVLMRQFMEKVDKNYMDQLFFTVTPQQQPGMGGQPPGLAGRGQPQIGETRMSLPEG